MLKSIHFLLSYMCNFECDHCFLYCSPRSKGTFRIGQVNEILDDLKRIPTVKGVGFEGGEPFLFYPLLVESVRCATEKGFKTAIETNTYWATDEEDAVLWLQPLQQAGLTLLEVSDDTFHHGEEVVNSAKRALSAAEQLGLGAGSICIDKPEIKEAEGQEKGSPLYTGGAKLRGRAIEKLTGDLPMTSWEKLTECPFEDLRDPARVHIDVFGNVHLCQGLSMGNLWETPLSEQVRTYRPEDHPICGPLLRGGPAQLAREHDLEHEDKYVDPCHFCSKMCLSLIDRFPEYLGPRQVYGLETTT